MRCSDHVVLNYLLVHLPHYLFSFIITTRVLFPFLFLVCLVLLQKEATKLKKKKKTKGKVVEQNFSTLLSILVYFLLGSFYASLLVRYYNYIVPQFSAYIFH